MCLASELNVVLVGTLVDLVVYKSKVFMALTRFLKLQDLFAFLSAYIATFEVVFKIYYLMIMLINSICRTGGY